MKAKEHGKFISEEINFLVKAHGFSVVKNRFMDKVKTFLAFFPDMREIWYVSMQNNPNAVQVHELVNGRSDAYYLWETIGGYYS